MNQTLYPRHRIDMTKKELAVAWLAAVSPQKPEELRQSICALWSAQSEVWSCVRSALEAWLSARRFPKGSQILLTAPTHPDLARIVKAHQLEPIGVDIDLRTLRPTIEELDKHNSPACVGLIVSNVYGARGDITPITAWCKEKGIDCIEDAATAFSGTDEHGHPDATMTLYSFGDTKHTTAFGGAMSIVRQKLLRQAMSAERATWPQERRSAFLNKLPAHTMLLLLRKPRLFAMLARWKGERFDHFIRESTRSIPHHSDASLLSSLRKRPNTAMLRLLYHRLQHYDAERARQRHQRGQSFIKELRDAIPGWEQKEQTHWAVPVATRDVEGMRNALRQAGFDTARGDASMAAVGNTPTAKQLLQHTVFVPGYPEIPEERIKQLQQLLTQWATPLPQLIK